MLRRDLSELNELMDSRRMQAVDELDQ